MRKAVLVAICLALLGTASAQGINVSMGYGTVMGKSAESASDEHFPQSIGGGGYLNFSAEYLLKGNFGVGAGIAWRASRADYAGVAPVRPLFYDFNAVYAPSFGRRAAADLIAGLGVASSRFYGDFLNCDAFTGTCTNYISSNHLMGHFGGGLRLYVTDNVFVRPEAHLYVIRNNVEFSGPYATRLGVSIGYSFGGSR